MGKAASTTLQELFSVHPHIFSISKNKGLFADSQLHFLGSSHIPSCTVISDERFGFHLYPSLLNGCAISDVPFYDFSYRQFLILKSSFPSAQILIVQRKINRKLLYSGYTQIVKAGYRKSFSTYCSESSSFYASFDKIVDLYSSNFHTHVLDYQKLCSNPIQFYKDLAYILEIDPQPFIQHKQARANLRISRKQIRSQVFINRIAFFLSSWFVFLYPTIRFRPNYSIHSPIDYNKSSRALFRGQVFLKLLHFFKLLGLPIILTPCV